MACSPLRTLPLTHPQILWPLTPAGSKEYDNQGEVLTQEGLSRGISLTQIPTLGVQGRGVSLWGEGRGLGGGLRLWSVRPKA